MSRENVEIVRAALEAFSRGDVERALALADRRMVSSRVDPDGAVFHGHEGLLQMVGEWAEQFTEWSYSGDEFVDAGDVVVVRTHQSGRGAVSGVPVEGDYWLVYAVAGGLITRVDIYSDKRQAMEAVGLEA